MNTNSANVAERRLAPPSLAISTVIFALRPSEKSGRPPTLWLPLVRRIREPYKDMWALPGGRWPTTNRFRMRPRGTSVKPPASRPTTWSSSTRLEASTGHPPSGSSPLCTGLWFNPPKLPSPTNPRMCAGSGQTGSANWPLTTTQSLTTPSGGSATRWRTVHRLPPAGRVFHPRPGPRSLRGRAGPPARSRKLPQARQGNTGNRRNR